MPDRGTETAPTCGKRVYWWDGEYEGECELPEGHEGDHWDGLSWFNDDNEMTDEDHRDEAGNIEAASMNRRDGTALPSQ